MTRTIYLIASVILILTFAACNAGQGEVPVTTSSPDVSNTGASQPPKYLTAEEKIIEQFHEAEDIYAWFMGYKTFGFGNKVLEFGNKADVQLNGQDYFRVTDRRFKNREELETFLLKTFDKETTTELMGKKAGAFDILIDFEDELYVLDRDGARPDYDRGEYRFTGFALDSSQASFTLEYSVQPNDDPIYDYLLLLNYKANYGGGRWQFEKFKMPYTEFILRAKQDTNTEKPILPTPPAESLKPSEKPEVPVTPPTSERIPTKGLIPQATETGEISKITIQNAEGKSKTFEANAAELGELEAILRTAESIEVPHPYGYEKLQPTGAFSITITYGSGLQQRLGTSGAENGFFRYVDSLGEQGDKGYVMCSNSSLWGLLEKYFAVAPPSGSPEPTPPPPLVPTEPTPLPVPSPIWVVTGID